MKKKVKDLTIEEIINFSQKYENRCTECPLYSISEIPCMAFCDYLKIKQRLTEIPLNQEIEVDCDE